MRLYFWVSTNTILSNPDLDHTCRCQGLLERRLKDFQNTIQRRGKKANPTGAHDRPAILQYVPAAITTLCSHFPKIATGFMSNSRKTPQPALCDLLPPSRSSLCSHLQRSSFLFPCFGDSFRESGPPHSAAYKTFGRLCLGPAKPSSVLPFSFSNVPTPSKSISSP